MQRPVESRRLLFLFTEVFANGGIQRFNQTILDASSQLGIACDVLSLNDSPAAIEQRQMNGDVSVRGFSGNRRRFALAVAAALMTDRYSRVVIGHINLLTLAVSVQILRPLHRVRILLIAHGIEVWSGLDWRRRHALSRADHILCVSRYTRQRILEQAPGLIADRLIMFPNALAAAWGHVVPLPFPRPVPVRFILSVSRLERGDRYKGIATTIEAFSMLADTSMQYLVIGHGNDLGFLELVAERCGVRDRVHFMRGISDSELVALYEQCDAFVLPSGKEGFGIVFLEAMFFGAPVIAAHEKGAMDVVRHGDTGLAVPFGDTIAIKESIERLGSSPALRERLRVNGRALVSGDGPFTFERFRRRCAEVFALDDAAVA
jgi:glycosyltransferase involved in cell wall biosynthesis